jgi:hypothetical protein
MSLCSSDRPVTSDSPASVFQSLGLQLFTTMPYLIAFLILANGTIISPVSEAKRLEVIPGELPTPVSSSSFSQ